MYIKANLLSKVQSTRFFSTDEKLLLLVRKEATPFALLVNHSSRYRAEVWENSFSRARIDRMKRKSAEVPEDKNYLKTT